MMPMQARTITTKVDSAAIDQTSLKNDIYIGYGYGIQHFWVGCRDRILPRLMYSDVILVVTLFIPGVDKVTS